MAFHVFLLGTPGCGKSEIYRRIERRLVDEGLARAVTRLDDFPKLWAIFMEDEKTGAWRRCRKTDDGGYLVTDSGVWDDILKAVNRDLVAASPDGQVTFVEFARPDMVRSIRENFSDDVKASSHVIYVDCPFDICWARNVARHEARLKEGGDDHLVSREEMEKTYGTDDHDRLRDLGIPFTIVENAREGTEHLDAEIANVMSSLRERLRRKG